MKRIAKAGKAADPTAVRKSRGRPRIARLDLLRAAAVLFARKGYRASTLDDLADALGVAKPTIYQYVTGKEALLLDVFEALLDMAEQRMGAIARSRLAPDEKLRRMVHDYVVLMAEEPDMATMWMREEASFSEKNLLHILRRNRKLERIFEAVVEDGQAAGLFRPIMPRLIVLGLFGMCSFVAYWVRLAKIDVDQIAGAFLLMMESGWLADGKPDRGAWPRVGAVKEALAGPQAQIAQIEALTSQLASGLAKAQARLETGLAGGKRRKAKR
jgi:AcrR family transcriptional regulator